MTVSTQLINTEGKLIEESRIQEFKPLLRGKLLRPGDDGYDSSRKIFNAMIDKHPALIVKCAGVADVIQSVNFARENSLPLAIKGGGHNVAGSALCDDGVVIDFSNMKSARVDAARKVVRAEPGLTWGEFDHETQAFGLATPGGINSTTGVAGFTLGGGIGWLMSKFGLTCDNLLSADVVTADGDFLTASPEENQDMFWGIRGGGGNFGVVTSFEFNLHYVPKVLGGTVVHHIDSAREVLDFLREFDSDIPDELGRITSFRTTPEGLPVIGVGMCYAGSIEEGEKVVEPIRKFGHPLSDQVRERSYLDVQKMLDQFWPPGLYCYWKSGFFEELSDEIIEIILTYVRSKPSPLTIVAIALHHGAAIRVKPDATAFNHRSRLHNLNIQAQWRDQADTETNLRWIREFWSSVEPFMSKRVYVNFLSQEGEDRVKAAYGDNYQRLVDLKNKYDPTNLFRNNQNIKPTL